jgi:hypothetical protein
MDPQFEELARVIRAQVAEDASHAIAALETRLEQRIDSLETQLEQRSVALETQLEQRSVAFETRLGQRADALEDRLEHRMQVHFERMEGLVHRAAEGYGATLESIDRRLDRLETKWDTQIADHGSVLTDHGRRISALEGTRK